MELQPGDACEECLSQGLYHKLRYFYINLEEQLLKCESRTCLWPHNDEVSSDEEEEEEGVESQSIPTTDDDDFIMHLLQELGTSEELPATETSVDTEASVAPVAQFSMPDLTEFGLVDLATSCENFLSIEPQPADSTKISISASPAPPAASAKISASVSPPPKLLSNLKACDKTLSMPATNTTKATAENATYAQPEGTPSINFTISQPEEMDLKPAITPAPKPQLFQLPPRKASTLFTKEQQPASSKPPPSKEMPPPSSTTSSFLDALRRQPVRPIRSPPQQKLPRKRRMPEAGAVPRAGPPPTQLVMQFLGRLGPERQKEVKTEGEAEVKKEAQ